MFKINLKGDEKIYKEYTDKLENFGVGSKFTDKYSRMEFSSLLFEKVIKNLTDADILDILNGLEIKEYYQFYNRKKVKDERN